MAIRVEPLTSADDPELTDFLTKVGTATPSVLGYHYPFYRDMLIEVGVGQPLYLAARADGELVGFLPAFAKECGAGCVYSSLPYFGPNAGVICGDEKLRAEIHARLLQTLLEYASRPTSLSCSVYTPFLFNNFELYNEAIPGAIVIDRFTQYTDLRTAAWSKNIAYDLRRAKQLGVEVSTTISPERVAGFYEIYEQNCSDYGIPPKSRRCVDYLLREELLGLHTNIYFAFHQEKMIGGLLMIWSPRTASYYLPCTRAGARNLQPGTLLIDQAVQDARERGIEIWNWESSPSRESGVYRFKKRWDSAEGMYRIYLQTFRDEGTFRELGSEGIVKNFPFYFVYPFADL